MDDKDGDMAEKVLKLFWSLAHSSNVTKEIMDQAEVNSVGFKKFSSVFFLQSPLKGVPQVLAQSLYYIIAFF